MAHPPGGAASNLTGPMINELNCVNNTFEYEILLWKEILCWKSMKMNQLKSMRILVTLIIENGKSTVQRTV